MENNETRRIIRNMLNENFLKKEERIPFNMPIPEDILKIKELLKNAGYKTFIVGGAVRDALLGKSPKDYDIATNALPDSVEKLMAPYYKTLPTGKAFGVINVFTPSGDYEIATFRKDIGIGRRPDAVEFTTIDQDVQRRDLTINALFYDIDTKEVVDLVGGVNDLKQGIVRTVGSAEERFNEDRLRILRAIRFAARFGSNLHFDIDAALKKDSRLGGFPIEKNELGVESTKNVSAERIRDEFLKGIISAKSVVSFLNALKKYNLFQWIFGSLELRTDYIEEKDIPILLAHLLQDNSIELLKKSLNELKYSVDEITQISYLLNLKNLNFDNAYKMKKAQANSKLNENQIRRFGNWEKLDINLINAFLEFKLSVTGNEVSKDGFSGKALGEEIEKREKAIFLQLFKDMY